MDYLHSNNLGQSVDEMDTSERKHASDLDKHVKPSREPIETGIPDNPVFLYYPNQGGQDPIILTCDKQQGRVQIPIRGFRSSAGRESFE